MKKERKGDLGRGVVRKEEVEQRRGEKRSGEEWR